MGRIVFMNAGAQSTCASPITAAQTSVTLVSAAGFSAIPAGGQASVLLLDSGNPGYSAANPLATPYEYQPINAIAGNVLTFGLGGGGASRAAYAGTTPKAYFTGATVAAVLLADDLLATIGGLAGPYHAEVYLAVQQNVGPGVNVAIAYDTVLADPNGNFTTGVGAHYTAPVAGRYLVTARTYLNNTGVSAASMDLIAMVNAVNVGFTQMVYPTGANNPGTWFSEVVRVAAAGQTIAVNFQNNATGTVGLTGGQAFTAATFTYMGTL